MNYTGDTNLPTAVIRYDSTTKTFQSWSGSAFAAMDICFANNVGIGTSSPAARFHVSDSSNTPAIIQSSGDSSCFLRFINTSNNAGYIGYITDYFSFVPNGTERMRLDASGNLGIGTSSPQAMLHVGAGGDAPSFSANVNAMVCGTTDALLSVRSASNDVEIISYAYSGGGIIGTFTNHVLDVRTNNTTLFTYKTSGQVRFIPLASDPSGGEAGDVYYNSSSNKLKVHNGTSWVDLH